MTEKKASRWPKVLIFIIALLAIAAIAAYFIVPRYMSSNEPSSEYSAPSLSSTAAADTDLDINGTWNINDADSFAGYRVINHMGQEDIEVVGRTSDITGTIEVSDSELTEANLTIDLTTVDSGDDTRDEHMRKSYLHTDEHPNATFVATKPVNVASITEGNITVEVPGELSIHGVTQDTVLTLEATVSGDEIVAVGTTNITWADFDVEAPSTAMSTVAETGTLEYQLTLQK
ncbi:MAG: YceI family protein [Corynebacterium sp.]|nr:YceI family protein [Corynebacterium sp.]